MKKLVSLCTIALVVVLLATTLFGTSCTCLFTPSPMPYGPKVTGDGTGGAIAVYEDIRGGNQHDFYVEKISPEGDIIWGDRGVLIGGGYKEWGSFHDLHIVSDGYGGALVSWVVSASSEQRTYTTYVARVDAEGNILWQENGIPLGITKGGGECPSNALVVSDGTSGAIITWEDLRQGLMSMYTQKIDADGNTKWQPGGEEVCYIETSSSFWPRTAVSDGSAGAIVTFGIRAQRIDSAGGTMWPDDGILFTERGTHAMDYDGHGGAVIAWGSGKSMFRPEKSYVQRIDPDGKLLWGEKGIRLNP